MKRTLLGFALLAFLAASGVGACQKGNGGSRAPNSWGEEPPVADSGALRRLTALYSQTLKQHQDLEYPELLQKIGATAESRSEPLGFDPRSVSYYSRIAAELQLTPQEQALFAESGMVGVDIGQRSSMGSAYYTIYARDLPVLVTSDSILHAFHRSFDASLEELEVRLLKGLLETALEGTHVELSRQAHSASGELRQSLADVDLYLSVAHSLLTPGASVKPTLADAGEVAAILDKIKRLELESPDGPCTEIYGGRRCIDYSQFRPRGHYAHSAELSAYFQAVMWLGRADLGWNLRSVDPVSGLVSHVERERRNACVLTLLLVGSEQLPQLETMNALVDLWVGSADNVTVPLLSQALHKAKIQSLAELAAVSALDRVDAALDTLGAEGQAIRSQVLVSPQGSKQETKLPFEFQVFGQRFLLDSYLLSRVVYDSIVYRAEKQARMMPSGLDVMATLGNDEAVRLLKPELERFHYSANLLAGRAAADSPAAAAFSSSVYHQWLGALRTLDDEPRSPHFPKVMQGTPWRRKQLQAQLGSWAELRHDTILYGKQSYTAYPDCEYPQGFVEPYPEFFERVASMSSTLASALQRRAASDRALAKSDVVARQATFFNAFADTARQLRELAEKELRAEPFSSDEETFLKKTIDIRGGGSGPPTYDGWYPQLIYSDEPAKWKPVVADVHTDPESQQVLQVGVGDVAFIVVAIDNQEDRAAYVGPIYSYYEFTRAANARMTDEEWEQELREGRAPARPAWTASFQAATLKRDPGRD